MRKTDYDNDYFKWQKVVGDFGGKANLFKFEKYINKHDAVIDFGCGGGFLLSNIETDGEKIGVEINESAHESILKNGAKCYSKLQEIENDKADVLISNHCLEHVDNPLNCLEEFKRVVKNGGLVVVCVPNEVSSDINVNDPNHHLYTWTPQNLYNLFKRAGFEILKCERLIHAWPPNYCHISAKVGPKLFDLICKLWGRYKKIYQTIIVAKVQKDS